MAATRDQFSKRALELGLLTQAQLDIACGAARSQTAEDLANAIVSLGYLDRPCALALLAHFEDDSCDLSVDLREDLSDLSDPSEVRKLTQANAEGETTAFSEGTGENEDFDFQSGVDFQPTITSFQESGRLDLQHERSKIQAARYEVGQLYAEGGLSLVWVARDRTLNRDVALKQIRQGVLKNPSAVQRFRREAQITGQLEHPHIVPIYEMPECTEAESLCYTMRLVQGETLREAADRYHGKTGSQPHDAVLWLRLLQAFVDVCQAIAYANSRGVIHRDIKPSNVVLGPFGEVVVLDWGLAKLRSDEEGAGSVSARQSSHGESKSAEAGRSMSERHEKEEDDKSLFDQPSGELNRPRSNSRSPSSGSTIQLSEDLSNGGQTMVGSVLGTPAFMAPEQADNSLGEVDQLTDVYGLGATLYYILTGRPPRRSKSLNELVVMATKEIPPRARTLRPTVDRGLDAICAKAMAFHRKDRYCSATALADDIQHYLADEPLVALPDSLRTKGRRWIKRNRLLVSASTILLITAAVALLVGNILLQQEQARTLVAKHNAQSLAAHMTCTRGLTACQQGDVSAGVLWLARGLELLPPQSRAMNKVLRTSLASWYRQILPVQQVIEPGQFPIGIGFDQESSALIIACRGGTVRRWDIATGLPLSDGITHDREFLRVMLLPPPLGMVTLDAEQSVHLWNADGTLRLGPLRTEHPVTVIVANKEADRLLLGSSDGVLSFWRLSDGTRLSERIELPTQIEAASYSNDGHWLVVGDASGIVRLIDRSGKKFDLNHGNWITGIDISPDGKWLGTACRDRQVRFWSLERLQQPNVEDLQPDGGYLHQGDVRFVRFNETSRLLMSGASDYTVRLWDLQSMEEAGPPLRHAGIPLDAKFLDEAHVITGASDNVIRTWNIARGRQSAPEVPVVSSLMGFAISGDDRQSLASLEQNGRVIVRSQQLPPSSLRLEHPATVYCLEFDQTGQRLFTGIGQQGDSIYGWNLGDTDGSDASDKIRPTIFPSSGYTFSLAVASHSEMLISGGTQSWLRFWDPESGQELRTGISGSSPIAGIALSADGSLLARVAWDDELHLYETASMKRLETVLRHRLVRSLVFDPTNSHRLVTGGRDGFARVWNRDTPHQPVHEFLHPAHVRGIDVSKDGRMLATACQDRMVRFWDLATGKLLGSPLQHPGAVNDVEFSPDGKLVVTGGEDGTARVWDVEQRMEILAPVRHAAPVLAVAFSPLGNRIASAGQDYLVQVVEIPTGWTEEIQVIRQRLQRLTGMRIDENNLLQPLSADQWKNL